MQKTRNMFILKGTPEDVATVMAELDFKGTITVHSSISLESALSIFSNNKSIICSETEGIEKFHPSPIFIDVTHTSTYTISDNINIEFGNIVHQFETIASRYECDIGDHKTNSSGLNGQPSTKDCAYCKLLKHQDKYTGRIVYHSANFFVVPTLGQFVKGYLLVIPINHVMSMAELNELNRNELVEVIEDVEYILNLTYSANNLLVWENGTGNTGIGKAKDSIVHSHLHIAPSNLTIDNIRNTSGFHFTPIGLDELSKYHRNSYLLIRGNNVNTWWINNNKQLYIPRQYIRQLLAEEHHISGTAWNWRTYPFTELMQETFLDISTALKSNWNTLPERIKTNTENFIN